MRVQFQILIFLACLNLATGMAIALTLPGTNYARATETGGTVTQYEERFNATKTAERWQSRPFSGIPLIGDIFAGLDFLVSKLRFLIDGFPMLLTWIKDTYITSSAMRTAFDVIANTLRAVFAIMMFMFVIEFISGRRMPD